MYSIITKNLHECKGVITKFNEVSEKQESSNIKFTDLEKIRIMFLAFSKILRDRILTNGQESFTDFQIKTIDKINFLVFIRSSMNIGFNQTTENNDDPMDIDNLNTLGSIGNNASNSIRSKYCHIYKTTGHTFDSCYYNKLTERNRKNNKKNNKNNKNKKGNLKKKIKIKKKIK